MPEVREDQYHQGSSTHYNIMKASYLPPTDGISSIQRPVGGHSQGTGTQTNELRDACGTTETLLSCASSAHGITELLEPCRQSAVSTLGAVRESRVCPGHRCIGSQLFGSPRWPIITLTGVCDMRVCPGTRCIGSQLFERPACAAQYQRFIWLRYLSLMWEVCVMSATVMRVLVI